MCLTRSVFVIRPEVTDLHRRKPLLLLPPSPPVIKVKSPHTRDRFFFLFFFFSRLIRGDVVPENSFRVMFHCPALCARRPFSILRPTHVRRRRRRQRAEFRFITACTRTAGIFVSIVINALKCTSIIVCLLCRCSSSRGKT